MEYKQDWDVYGDALEVEVNALEMGRAKPTPTYKKK